MHRLRLTVLVTRGGTIEMKTHNTFGQEAVPVFTPVIVVSNIIASMLLRIVIATLIYQLH